MLTLRLDWCDPNFPFYIISLYEGEGQQDSLTILGYPLLYNTLLFPAVEYVRNSFLISTNIWLLGIIDTL